MQAVEISSGTNTFGAVTAAANLTLNVPAGCVYGFIGRNGSGKTAALRTIASVFLPDSGSLPAEVCERRLPPLRAPGADVVRGRLRVGLPFETRTMSRFVDTSLKAGIGCPCTRVEHTCAGLSTHVIGASADVR